jgi:D-3-phosphoglycerate dehydrogenase / 2-oxoglutarate reductase
MTPKILVTTSSFTDTPGPHIDELAALGCEIVKIRGPLSEVELLGVIEKRGPFLGLLVGEDQFTETVLERLVPHTKGISRYGVGLDKIDLEAAQRLGIPIATTPGSNHTTVTEHAFGLLLSVLRQIPEHNEIVHSGKWKRFTGMELAGKKLGIFGFGRVGKEMVKRALAFGMKVMIYNSSWSQDHEEFIVAMREVFSNPHFSEYPPSIERVLNLDELLAEVDIISLHMNLTKNNTHFLNARRLHLCKRGVVIINVSRGRLIDQASLANAIRSGKVAAFAADVLDPEPVEPSNPLLGLPYVHLTPHVGSRTLDSVIRQGLMAVQNLKNLLEGVPVAEDQRASVVGE